MAFQQVTVENRVSEFPNRRTLTKEDNTTEIVTVTRNEGNVSTEGTAWGAAYANDLESRINTETNLLETNFGHVETTTTASKPYSVGDTLVLNGQMYKVTAAIAQGAKLTVGTNIAVHSVSAINSNLGTLSFVKSTDGKWGYKVAGADPVIPFNNFSLDNDHLIWTNSSPLVSFSPQTVTIDLSTYKFIVISVGELYGLSQTYYESYCLIDMSSISSFPRKALSASAYLNYEMYGIRSAIMSNSSVQFLDAYEVYTAAYKVEVNNIYAVPAHIWGFE